MSLDRQQHKDSTTCRLSLLCNNAQVSTGLFSTGSSLEVSSAEEPATTCACVHMTDSLHVLKADQSFSDARYSARTGMPCRQMTVQIY